MREIKVGRLLPIIGSDQIMMVTGIKMLNNGDRELALSNGCYATVELRDWVQMSIERKGKQHE